MRVCVRQTAVDLLVVLVVNNLRRPSAVIRRAKYNIVSLASLIPLCRVHTGEGGGSAVTQAQSARQPCATSVSCANLPRYATQRIDGHNLKDVYSENLQAKIPAHLI